MTIRVALHGFNFNAPSIRDVALFIVSILLLGRSVLAYPAHDESSEDGRAIGKVPEYGFSVHLWNESEQNIRKKLEIISQMGAKIVRWDAPWAQVEKVKGQYGIPSKWFFIRRTMEELGLKSLYILDYGNPAYSMGGKPLSDEAREAFGRYATYLVKNLGGPALYGVEIWNEWDQATGGSDPGSAADYVKLVSVVSPAVRQIGSDVKVVGGAFGSSAYKQLLIGSGAHSYLQEALSHGLCRYLDILSIHPYTLYRSEVSNDSEGMISMIRKIVHFSRMNAPPGERCPRIAISEVGWSTARSERGVSQDVQAAGLRAVLEESRNLQLDFSLIYELRDGGIDESSLEDNFGILFHDWSRKAAFGTVSDFLDRGVK